MAERGPLFAMQMSGRRDDYPDIHTIERKFTREQSYATMILDVTCHISYRQCRDAPFRAERICCPDWASAANRSELDPVLNIRDIGPSAMHPSVQF
jgi:hypothetical protein